MIKKVLVLSLSLIGLISTTTQAESRTCRDLNNLLSQEASDFKELDRLKYLCERDLIHSPDKNFIATLGELNYPLALKKAQGLRIDEYLTLTNSIREAMKPFTEVSQQQDLNRLDVNAFTEKLKTLGQYRKKLEKLKQTPFENHVDRGTKIKIEELLKYTSEQVQLKGIDLLRQILALDKSYKSRAEADVAKLSRKIQSYLDTSEKTVGAFQVRAGYRSGSEAIKDFEGALAPEVLKLKATAAWGKFIAKSGLSTILRKSDLDYRSGFVDSGREKLKISQQLISEFLSHLPKSLAQAIKDSDPFKVTKAQNDRRAQTFGLATEIEVYEKQKEYLAFQSQTLAKVQKKCGERSPHFSDKLNLLQSEYQRSAEPSVVNSLDSDVRQFLLESLGNRFDIYLDLCAEVAK